MSGNVRLASFNCQWKSFLVWLKVVASENECGRRRMRSQEKGFRKLAPRFFDKFVVQSVRFCLSA